MQEQDEKRFSHAVRGLTGKEEVEASNFNSFCNLCRRKIPKGSQVLVLPTADGSQDFYIHVDCAIARFKEVHHATFLQEVKMRSRPKRTGQPPMKVHVGDGASYCNFCGKAITLEQEYVREKKKRFHRLGRGDCFERYKKAVARRRTGLGK